MKTILVSNAWEIMNLGSANGVDTGIARDMFCENLATYGTDAYPAYTGADVDYESLSAIWKGMSANEQGDAKILYKNAVKDTYDEITKARRENDVVAFYEALLSYKEVKVEKPAYVLFGYAWDCWDYAVKHSVDIIKAKDVIIAGNVEWNALSEKARAIENDWFARTVVMYDRGLEGCYLVGNRDLFESVLATR